ncbi:hypothetical protein EMPS_06091 [Entomortierella parvispora]|uniref:G-protein coupled receptors family 3 profile domain-containing protein n=1 Tax=Entomortierella parvispora TaxID=205924 RepID=A0A9P3LX47_9FUNG|nr:hypothetical protein EMPS_06091 [Entomortierella parvispora]
MLDVVRSMGWKRISLIYDIDTLGWAGREYFSARASKMGIFILAYQPLSTAGVPFDPTYKFVRDRIESSQSPDYAWITVNDISSQLRMESDVQDFDGLMMVDNGWEMNGYEPYEAFLEKWLTLNPDEYPGAGDPTVDNNESMAYSCVMMLAHAYADLINEVITDPTQIPHSPLIQELIAGDHTEDVLVSETFRDKPYRGPAGPITLDGNGDRKEGYYVALSLRDGKPVHFGIIFSGNFTSIRKPFFKDSHPDIPKDAPPWAIQNPRWKGAGGVIYGILCCLGIAATLISAELVIYFRNHIIIKASRSLTVKNYRIYRIFNSVTVSNQAFQTRLLLRYVALGVFLGAIPMVVEMIVDAPEPNMINIRAFQWVRCRGIHTQVWWVISAAIIPALLILFGVFLAFKTRNVVFLWNEARQISLVLYNVFFFAIIIVVAQAFPLDLYLATFYISIVGTLFIAALSLIVLFLPKFWGIWKSLHKPWGEDGHPSQQNQTRLGGGFGGAAVMGRMPGDIKVSRRPAIAGGGIPASDLEMAGGKRSSITAEKVLDPVFSGARKRSSTAESTTTSNGMITKIERNPLGAWMNARIPQKGNASTARTIHADTFSSESLPLDDGVGLGFGRRKWSGALDTAIQAPLFEDENEHQVQRLGRHEQDATDAGAGGEGEEKEEPLRSGLQAERTFGSSSSGAHRMLDAYVFLLPIRVHKSRIASLLSHWSMATLILMPEAHAFLSVDSTDGRSTSYLMLSMYQLQNEPDPTIRVTTCHAGTLLIRFSSQYRLDSWMSLFSEEDLQALSARSASTSSTNSTPPHASGCPTGGGGLSGGAVMRRRSANVDGVPDFMSQPITNMRSMVISPEMANVGIPGLGGPPYSDPCVAPPAPSSWTSRLSISNSLSRLWHRTDSVKSTSGASSQSVYAANNTFNQNYNQFPPSSIDQYGAHPHQVGSNGEFYEDVANGAARWARPGIEWTSTDSNASNYIPTGQQFIANRRENSNSYFHRKSLKNQAPFIEMGRSEDVMEDKEAERESPLEQKSNGIANALAPEIAPIASLSVPKSSELAAIHPSAPLADISADDISVSNPNQGEDALKDQQQPSTTIQSQESQENSIRPDGAGTTKAIQSETASLAAPKSNRTPGKPSPVDPTPSDPPRPNLTSNRSSMMTVDVDNDDDDDDLYDPEFGIGGGQRRRRRRKKPSRLNTNLSISGNATIPSAAVISAAAAAVSAGWSETEALAAAMANSPALSQILPPSNATSPSIQENRSWTGSQASTSGSYFRLGGNRSRKESVGEDYLSSSSASSMYPNHAGDVSGKGAGHMATRMYNDRVNMSPANSSNGKRMSASAASMLQSPAPSSSQPSSATTPTMASPLALSPRRALGLSDG